MGLKVGFTGTRKGLTQDQDLALYELLESLDPDEFHHGSCIGSDAEAHEICQDHTLATVVVHPPDNTKHIAWVKMRAGDRLLDPKPYLKRSRDIVSQTDMLIATPEGNNEELRSGTWATIRRARRLNKPITIIYPDGVITKERS